MPLLCGGDSGRAIVCKHCGRNLIPETATKTRKRGFLSIIGIGAAIVVGLIVVGMVVQQGTNQRDSAGKCVLQARADVVAHNTPIGQAMHWNTDILGMRNMDGADWNDLDITIYSFVTT